MYATCLFCHSNLGTNETLETFRVGRRLAFDGARGRLWVVCSRCGRWNLTPLEERWEAIEEAERNFAAAELRAATEQIGLARTREGTDLIRIGKAGAAEFRTWRYGARLRRRRIEQYVYTSAVLAAGGLLFGAGGLSLLAAIPGGGLVVQIPQLIHVYQQRRGVVARVPDEGGGTVPLRGIHVHAARIEYADGEHRLVVKHDTGYATLDGPTSIEIAARVLARLNLTGASRRALADAMAYLDRSPTALMSIRETARKLPGPLLALPGPVRYAMEIAAQEETERHAMEEDLKLLEDARREAEEIAAIADRLLIPDWIEQRLDRMRS